MFPPQWLFCSSVLFFVSSVHLLIFVWMLYPFFIAVTSLSLFALYILCALLDMLSQSLPGVSRVYFKLCSVLYVT